MLRIEFDRQSDGSVVFRCTRGDGTTTWQKHAGKTAAFFPFHDLTHYAVETAFAFRDGFYGLIDAGWDIGDTGGKGARGALPREAVLAEHVVGLFDTERVGGAPPLTADEFNKILSDLAASRGLGLPPVVTDAQLAAVRSTISELYDRLATLQPGHSMELSFEAAGERAS
jgi:hypothetical protein